jgi:membrane-associated phospholipid phosphatase
VLLRTRGHGPAGERAFGALGRFGEWGLGWVALAMVGSGLDRERRRGWWSAGAVGPVAVAINYGVKLAVGRERPLIKAHPMLARAPSRLSFPSAHATSSVAAATAMSRLAPGVGPPLGALAAAVCISRPFLGMHYPSDVLAGALLGRLIGRAWPLPGGRSEELWAR